mmetsp:Transcript_62053/g.202467  ORF Transcript_62053/g.202467 Transcript_62053/m.202467 type:complete len:223 (+) Transcript_62053:3019-3687(+)
MGHILEELLEILGSTTAMGVRSRTIPGLEHVRRCGEASERQRRLLVFISLLAHACRSRVQEHGGLVRQRQLRQIGGHWQQFQHVVGPLTQAPTARVEELGGADLLQAMGSSGHLRQQRGRSVGAGAHQDVAGAEPLRLAFDDVLHVPDGGQGRDSEVQKAHQLRPSIRQPSFAIVRPIKREREQGHWLRRFRPRVVIGACFFATVVPTIHRSTVVDLLMLPT